MNIEEFLREYNNFHDSNFKNINYNVIDSTIEVVFDAVKQENYERHDITLIFKNVKELRIKEVFSWDFINNSTLKLTQKDNESLFLFTDDESSPNIFILCKEMFIK